MIPWSQIKACLFDLDGTLIDSETIWMKAQTGYMNSHFGASLTCDEWIRVYWGHSWKDIFDSYDRRWIHGRVTSEQMSEETMAYYREYCATHDIVIHGALDLLKQLKAIGYQVGIVSGAHKPRAVEFAAQQGLQLDCLVASGDYQCGKPAPDGYLAALPLLGRQASECLVFEDSPTGVQSAKAAGMWCVGVQRPGWPEVCGADEICGELSQFQIRQR